MSIVKGEAIKNWRLSEGLTLQELGQLMSCSHATVAKWEKSEIPNIGTKNLFKLFYLSEALLTPNIIFGVTTEFIENEKLTGKLREGIKPLKRLQISKSDNGDFKRIGSKQHPNLTRNSFLDEDN